MKNIKIGFISLGCAKNQLDTEVMLNVLADEGFEITNEETEADVIVINTCAFITDAKQESIDNILDVAWLKKHLRSVHWDNLMIVKYGTPKNTLSEGYLFDDEARNRELWGEGANDVQEMVAALRELLA